MSDEVKVGTCGFDHAWLSDRDLATSRKFFSDCLGWRIVGERPDYPAAFVSDGVCRSRSNGALAIGFHSMPKVMLRANARSPGSGRVGYGRCSDQLATISSRLLTRSIEPAPDLYRSAQSRCKNV